jgi:hypothetical protein
MRCAKWTVRCRKDFAKAPHPLLSAVLSGRMSTIFVMVCPECGAPDAVVTIGEERGDDGELIRSWLQDIDCDNDECRAVDTELAAP